MLKKVDINNIKEKKYMTRFILDNKTGTTYYYFNDSGEIGFIPRMKERNRVEIVDTNEGGVVDIWDDKEDEQRIRTLLDN